MATIRHSATLGIGAQLARSWSSSVGAVVSGTGKIKGEVDKLKVASHEASSRLKDMLASGRYYGQSAESVRRLRGEHERLTNALEHQQRRLQSLKAWHDLDAGNRASASLGRIGSGLASVGTAAAVAAGAVAGAGVAALTWFTKSAVDATSKLETMQTSLETLEGSPEKAKASLDWITKFAAETPFKLDEVGEAYTRLRAYGIDPTDGSLRTLGDTAAAMGKKAMDAVEAIADAVTGENERLKEFGIRGSVKGETITYRYKDAGGKDMVKTVSKNSQTMIQQTLMAIWNEKYAGGMAKQAKTWKGMIAGIEDQWMLFQVRVMQSGPFERMKAKLEKLQGTINTWANDGTLDKWAIRIGQAYEAMFDKLEQGFNWLDANWDSKVIPGMKSAWEETQKLVNVVVTLSSWLMDASGGAGNLAIGVAALGAASTLAPVFSLVKVGLDVVGWLSKATGLTGVLAAGFARVAAAAGLAQGAAAAATGAGAAAGAAGGAAAGFGARVLTAAKGVATKAAPVVAIAGAAYGGYKFAEHMTKKWEAEDLATPEARAQRQEDHRRRVAEASERVRRLREAKAPEVEAARKLAEREGLVVEPKREAAEAPAVRGALEAPKPPVIELPKPEPLTKTSTAAENVEPPSVLEREVRVEPAKVLQLPKRDASEAQSVRGAREAAPKAPVIELPKPEAPRAPVIEVPKPEPVRGREAPAAPPEPTKLPQPPKPAAAEVQAVRGAREAPKPPVFVLPKPEQRAVDRAAPESVQQNRPAVTPADVRTVTLTPPAPAVTNIHKYDNRKFDVKVDAQGADANEVARVLERRLQSESLASYEGG